MKILLGALALLTPALLVPAMPSYAVAPTCHEHAATIVGTPGQVLRGTTGDDVIVSNGATRVFAGAGDDVVCATGSSRRLDAGPGADAVDTMGTSLRVRTILGEGDDDFTGGDGFDTVVAGSLGDTGESVDVGTDDISTGTGGAQVTSGMGDEPNLDYLTLGDADGGAVNSVYYEGIQDFVYGDVSFGTGPGRMYLSTHGPRTESVSLRPSSVIYGGSFHEDGTQRVFWNGATTRVVLRFGHVDDLSVMGTPEPDAVELVGDEVDGLAVSLAGGDDDLILGTCLAAAATSDDLLDAGTGIDTLEVGRTSGCRRVDATLDGLIELDGRSLGSLRRFEVADAWGRNVTLTGNFHDNRLVSHACRTTLRGGAGADVLRAAGRSNCFLHAEEYGGPGPDRLVGSPSSDLLVGGPNRDVAVGRGGGDTCRAEVTRGCENVTARVARASAFECQGQPATIVGQPGDHVVGTDGPDVILTFDGAFSVDAGAGDDLICTNGDMPRVDAGPGDDSVMSSSPRPSRQLTILGEGQDRFLGGEGFDAVYAGTADVDVDQDLISTGDGGAVVRSGDDDPSPRGANQDDIVLARGDTGRKTVWYGGWMGGGGALDAGFGHTTLHLADTGGRASSWKVDGPGHRITIDGLRRVSWSGHVTHFELSAPNAVGRPTELTFQGTPDDEVLLWTGPSGLLADVRMGPGKDRAVLTGSVGSRAYGGSGADLLTGGGGDDLLRGGTGRDRIDGRGGIDSCYGEVRLRCER